MPVINIVFDIDDSIATAFNKDASMLENEHPCTTIFKKNGLYIDALKPHIIHPGVIEFIQLISIIPNVKISFFSGAIKERNEIFVEKLLCLALGKKRYEDIKSQVIICSREDLEDSDNLNKEQYNNYGIQNGNKKKNLNKVLTAHDEISWAVLIDDDITYSYYGQEKNISKIPAADDMNFDRAYRCFMKNKELDWETFSRVNHIFYAAGIIFSALEIADKEEKTFSDALFKIQFKENENIDSFNSCKMTFRNPTSSNRSNNENYYYYEFGLRKLKEINSNLCFLNSENFLNQSSVNSSTKSLVENLTSHSSLYHPIPVTTNENIDNNTVEQQSNEFTIKY